AGHSSKVGGREENNPADHSHRQAWLTAEAHAKGVARAQRGLAHAAVIVFRLSRLVNRQGAQVGVQGLCLHQHPQHRRSALRAAHQRSMDPVPPAYHGQRRAGMRSPC
ncbi:MAG: hypothetical protein ACK56I_07840, partial [bacterium]